MQIYILDDQFSKLSEIKTAILQLAADHDWSIQVKIFTNVFDLEDVVFEKGQYADIYFLDLDQNGVKLGGINFAKRVRELDVDTTISFISKFPTLMQQLFVNHIGAYDFINKRQAKPALMADLAYTIDYHQRMVLHRTQPAKLMISNAEQAYFIAPSEIMYIETTAVAHQLKLVTTNREILFYDKLSDLQNRLTTFIRSHRACLINPQQISQINYKARTVMMQNQAILPVSRTMINKLCEKMTINEAPMTV